jgi:2-phospho-L-lactate guanylyltransferase
VPAWTVVIPLKPSGLGKTRLGADAALARAIALDTVEAASGASRVGRVIVVTADESLIGELDAMAGVELVVEPRPSGIAAALELGFAVAGEDARAALLGDLPGLVPEELDTALELAEGFERAFVRDAEGSGTTLVTARSGVGFVERFGPGSAAAHRAAGLAELDVSALSSVRHDVDDAAQLEALARRGPGPRTRAHLDGSGTP